MWGFGLNAFFSTILTTSLVFSTDFMSARNGSVTDLPNKTNASQKDKCDVLEQCKNESIKYQASELFGESEGVSLKVSSSKFLNGS